VSGKIVTANGYHGNEVERWLHRHDILGWEDWELSYFKVDSDWRLAGVRTDVSRSTKPVACNHTLC